MCVCIWNARRHARARPKGVSRRGPEGATAAAGRQGVLEGGGEGVTPPPKKSSQKQMFANNFPEGRQGCWRGGKERGSPPPTPPNKFSPKKLFRHKIPRRGHCGCRPPGVLKGGRNGGEVFPTFKKTGREAPHNYLVLQNTSERSMQPRLNSIKWISWHCADLKLWIESN